MLVRVKSPEKAGFSPYVGLHKPVNFTLYSNAKLQHMHLIHLLSAELTISLAKNNLLFQSWFVIAFLLIIAFSKDDVKKEIGKSNE